MDEKIKEAQIEAEKRLEKKVSKKRLRYSYCLHQEMKKILKEQGIDWEYKTNTHTVLED